MNIILTKLIQKIKRNGVKIQIENRSQVGLHDYGLPKRHVELIDYINIADNDKWDGLILGYKNHAYEYGTILHTNMIVGVTLVEDGNHKLIFKIPYKRSFNNALYKKELNHYMKKYKMENDLNIKYHSIL